jgi:tetratricopeptide (TPR) repeat protein
MSHPMLKELTRAKSLLEEGQLDNALELLNDESRFEELDFDKKYDSQFLKGLILYFQNKNLELIRLGRHMFKEGQESENVLLTFDGLYFILLGLCLENKFDEAHNRYAQAETLITQFSEIKKNEKIKREHRLNIVKAWIYMRTGKLELAERCLEEILQCPYELDDPWELIWANLFMASFNLLVTGNIDNALEYNESVTPLIKKVKYSHYWLGYYHVNIGVVHMRKCEYDLSFEHHMKSLEYFKQINNNMFIANLYNNLGILHRIRDEYDTALEYLEKAIKLWEPYPYLKEACLDTLISVSLEKGDIPRAEKYFKHLEVLYNETKNPGIEELYKYNKALMLKQNSRIRDKAKAEEIFKYIIESDIQYYEVKISSYVHICDLLLEEFRIYNNSDVLEELNKHIDSLLKVAEKNHSYYILCNTLILQAKISLLNFNLKEARRYLTQAQKIAERYGIKRLAMKISQEHDELIRQSEMWENFKLSEMSLPERWKLIGLSEQMEKIVKKRMIEPPELFEEEPVLLLIVSEGGVPFFSHSFIQDKTFESHLFGGFLTTIDYFINETFSEGLDRAVFGEYTLLMKSVPPFFIAYIFKGQSYYALQKMNSFIGNLQKNTDIWMKLLRYFRANQTIQLNDFSSLDSLITDTFLVEHTSSK